MRIPILLLLLFTLLPVFGNPFLQPEPKIQESKSISARIMEVQKELHSQIGKVFSAAKESPKAMFSFFLITFLYGIFHALGPGHRKTIIAAYASKPKTERKQTITLSVGFAILHSTSAIVLVSAIIGLAKLLGTIRPGQTIRSATRIAEISSYSLLILVGIYLLWEFFSHLKTDHHHHNHDHGRIKDMSFWGILISGATPCPGSSLILILAATQQAFWLGIIGVMFMSLGLCLVLTVIGLGSFALRKSIQNQTNKSKWADKMAMGIEVSAATVVLLFGVLMVYGTLQQPVGF